MQEILRFVGEYQGVLYFLLALAGVYSLRRLTIAWREWRQAYFGLEREVTQQRLAQAVVFLATVLMLTCVVFSISVFVLPGLPVASASGLNLAGLMETSPRENAAGTITPGGAGPAAGPEGCVPGRLEITAPRSGEEVSGTVTLIGTVDVPNFGFYKYEVSLLGSEIWSTVAAWREPVRNGELGKLNTTFLTPGDYLLRVVALDTAAQEIGVCVISIRVRGE